METKIITQAKWDENIKRLMNKKMGDIITAEDFIAIAECLEVLMQARGRVKVMFD